MSSANEQITITMTGDAASVQRMFGDLNKRMKDAGKGAEKMTKTMNKNLTLSSQAAAQLSSRFITMGAAAGAVSSAIGIIASESERARQATLAFLNQSSTAAKRFKEDLRGVAIQLNLNRLQESAAGEEISRLAIKNKVPVSFALATAKQLGSSGLDTPEIFEGGALDSTLQFAVATTATGGDPTAAVKAQVQFLSGTGQKVNAKNLKALQVDLQNKFVPTNIQLSAIPNIAEQASTLTNLGVSPTDITALFATLLSSKTAGPAATSLGALADSFSGISGSADKTRALSRFGLKPTDVDFVDEDVFQIIKRFRKGFEKANPETRQGDLTKIFGREGKRALLDFIARPDDLNRIRKLTGDEAGFDCAVTRGTTGPVAASQSAATRLNLQRAKGDGLETQTMRDNIEAEALRRGMSPGRTAKLLAQFDNLISRDFTPRKAALAAGKGLGAPPPVPFGSSLNFLQPVTELFGTSPLAEKGIGPRFATQEAVRLTEGESAVVGEIRALRKSMEQPKEITVRTPAGARVPATAAPTDLQGLNQQR